MTYRIPKAGSPEGFFAKFVFLPLKRGHFQLFVQNTVYFAPRLQPLGVTKVYYKGTFIF
jgi:hypothetical protein